MDLDLLLRGATVLDGTGGPPRRLDVGIRAGRIMLGSIGPAARDIDLDGLVLAPGFVDIHTHSDVSLLHDPAGESAVLQGVTTQVVGNCGYSPFPVHPERRADLADHLARLGDPRTAITWSDLNGYAASMHPALNVAPLVGHGALRIAAMAGPYGPASAGDLARMRELLDAALAAGAFGLSTGLTHSPSSSGDPAEVTALVEVVARHDAMYATHARAAAGKELDAIDEAISAARDTGGRLQFSHLALNDPAFWGRAADALARFDDARAAGLDVAFDVYPYDASSSAAIQYLPLWAQDGGSDGLRAAVAFPAGRERVLAGIREGFFGGIPWHWDRIVVTWGEPFTGQSIAQIAADLRKPPEDVLLDLCVTHGGACQVVLHYRTEADMTAFLAHPLSVVGSDGSALPIDGPGLPHPRAFGTFPRVLGRYARDTGLLTLPEAVHKMTLGPARRLGLADRGEIRLGARADLVAFDPVRVADRATFAAPRQAPDGIALTIVDGVVVARDGSMTGARPGKVLRRG
ncbi:N-acyl-D-amino-acid deacylase family protein [Paractinoplanes rishiriensis]|uniref:N-acyl-D-amino-acid deacylase n=1 Tax=Paractinoplanes rishiriensis TaxID=1050105 RepID=A0A919K6R2_9ACTN|nr:D-aminoacylase [Actinoplanes rishiriensis]GIE99940.1 N-acyl-D-amino-acid deacylase [Actinoplanes rishiriensis]